MSLTDADEYLHQPPHPVPDHWQENLFYILWDTCAHDGFMMHVQRVPGRQVQEARIVACIAGQHASATLTGPFAPDVPVEGVHLDVHTPWRKLGVRANFAGHSGVNPLGFIAAYPSGATEVAVDLHLESDLDAIDFAAGIAHITSALRADDDAPQMGDQAHYEQGGRWHGSITIGDTTKECSGLFVRDHSWGIRHEHSDPQAFWTATCLDDGALFANAIGVAMSDGVAGIGAVVDQDGVRFTTEVGAEILPRPGLLTYDRAQVTYGKGVDMIVNSWAQQHWPMYLPFSGPNRCDNNAMSIAESDGKQGFAVIEWATTMTPDKTAILDAAAGPAAANYLMNG